MNKVILTGRLGNSLEVKETSNGKKVANFSLLVNEGTSKKLYIKCTVWDKMALLMEKYLEKGSLILIEGKIDKNKYMTSNGDYVEDTYVVVEKIEFLEPKAKTGGSV